MTTTTIPVELPAELVALPSSPAALAARARQSLVLDLLREAEISQGKAAELLGVSRWRLLDLMARYHVPSGPQSAEEMREEIEAALGCIRLTATGAGAQQE